MAKKHWTQTTRGRKIMAEHGRRRGKNAVDKEAAPEEASKEQAAYVFGYVQAYIHTFARSTRVSEGALAKRVGALLQRS